MNQDTTQLSYAGSTSQECSFCRDHVPHSFFEHEKSKEAFHRTWPQATMNPEPLVDRLKKMSSLDVVLALEQDDLLSEIQTKEEAAALLEKISPLEHSTGSYQRLCVSLREAIED